MRLEITHIKFPEHTWHLITGNCDHPQPRVKAPKHTKAAMPISYCALPFPGPFEIALKNKSTLAIPLIFQAPMRSAKEFPPAL